MSDTKKLAERLAGLLESEQRDDIASIFGAIEKLNHRLDKLEAAASDRSSEITGAGTIHPSGDRFAVLEAVADKIVDGLKKEKACAFEPNDRSCDHCSMCSSRGF